jgi:hypothetical protein
MCRERQARDQPCGHQPSDSGASVRHDKVLYGRNALSQKKLPKVATEMALNVLAYNMKRVMMIVGVGELLEAMQA